jgi:N12 class adenine-specific DNA methylase
MSDFFFLSTRSLDLGTPSEKVQGNLEAIRILKRCTAENRLATPDELTTLARYTGWGDSAVLRHLSSSEALRGLLTVDELRAARGSALNAHYTALPVIGAIWEGLTYLGFDHPGLRILDPSAGIGHFKSGAPETLHRADWVEIELDHLTAGILGLLHPESKVYAQGYETVELPEGWFDLAITNVPFGNYGVASRKLPAHLRGAIHDFFFANTISLLRPGGVMAFITSRYTLDKKESQVRQWLAKRLDLLAAVRLPSSAFKANAGTEVVTDILILQKRSQEASVEPEWVQTVPVEIRGKYLSKPIPVNRYYASHPQRVLGLPSLTGTMYSSDSYNVEPDGRELGEAIREALLEALPEGLLRMQEPAAERDAQPPALVLTTARGRSPEQERRIHGLHDVYRAAKEVLAAETEGRALVEVGELRRRLNQVYVRFLDEYGPINRTANARLLAGSVEMPFLKALEIYDPVSATARKAGIFSGPLVRAATKHETPSVEDALLVCLDQRGKVDIAHIACLSGLPEAEAIRQLDERIYQLPTGGWETSDAYLCGNVREKLRQAQAAAGFDPAFERNVCALTRVLPEPLAPGQIRAPLGAGWIPTEVVEGFLSHLLSAGRYKVTYIPSLAHWEIDATYAWEIPTGLAHGRWGTGRVHALDLIDDGLNARTPVVYDTAEENGQGGCGEASPRILNQVETVAAQARLAEIKVEFERWLWSDAERAERLAAIYNERYNAHRVRQYDGAHLSTPGLNRAITLRPHQKNAIWRVLQCRTALLAHEVGMGKTLTGLTAAMESKRLCMTRKAMVVVPNHLTAQWHAQALWAYPNANLLVASASDLSKTNRGVFLSRIAANDWDLVIVPFSSFKLLPVSPKTMGEFYQREIDRLEEYLWELQADKASTRAIKEIEKSLKRFRVKLENASGMAKDSAGTITWEELGVDMLIVDEFAAYKNLFFGTRMNRIAGLANSDSQRAFDMFVKLRWTLGRGGKVVGMTGTPITNTIAEMYTMQRYFQMETLEALGLSHFDAWANQFALAEPGLEMTPDGAGFRMNTRFRKFVNLPELMQLWRQVVDTQRIDEKTGIDRPELYIGRPVKVISQGGPVLKEYTASLAARAERVRSGMVRPEEDNMLKITGDGRKAALDLSLVIPSPPDASMPKIDALVEVVSRVYAKTNPTQGVQVIFCDLATPKTRS